MEPGPLPPHERTWRHPSELAPTRVDVDVGSSVHVAAFAAGLVAVMAVAVLVVAMTPRAGSGPVAISATTAPMLLAPMLSGSSGALTDSAAAINTPLAARFGAVVRPQAAALLGSFVAFPHSITAGPQFDLDGSAVAARIPNSDDSVYVRTNNVTYRLRWSQVPLLAIPDGSVVFDTAGDLVAYVIGGDLIDLVAG